MVYAKIFRHGNSKAIILPAEMCRDLGLSRGDYLMIGYAGDDILVLKKANSSMAEFLKNKPIKYDNAE